MLPLLHPRLLNLDCTVMVMEMFKLTMAPSIRPNWPQCPPHCWDQRGETQKIARREIASRRVSPTGRWRLLRTDAALLRQEVATISQGGSLPREEVPVLASAKEVPRAVAPIEATAEPGEDHTPDTHGYTPAHSGGCEVPF